MQIVDRIAEAVLLVLDGSPRLGGVLVCRYTTILAVCDSDCVNIQHAVTTICSELLLQE